MIYRILNQKRITFIIIGYIVIASIAYIAVSLNEATPIFFDSTMLTSKETKNLGGMYMMVIFPVISSYILSDIYLIDESLNIKYIWYSKKGIFRYHVDNILAIFILTFFITFICYGFNIFLCYLTFGDINISNTSFFNDLKLETYKNDIVNFDLLLKSPLKFFIVKNFYISFFASLFGILSYNLSTFIKNKYIIILLPTIFYNIINLLSSVLSYPGKSLYHLLTPRFSVIIDNESLIYVYLVVIAIINLILFSSVLFKESKSV